MLAFSFYVHDDIRGSPLILTETLRSVESAKRFGRRLLAENPDYIAVEVHAGDTRITTIKQIGGGQTSSTRTHEIVA